MNRDLNIRAWISVAEDSADFTLLLNAVDPDGKPLATLGSVKVDPGTRLHDIIQSFRMGAKFGKIH